MSKEKTNIENEQYKEIIAFTNTMGETVFMGISKAGKIEPLTDIEKTYSDIIKGIYKAIAPDVTIFSRFTIEKDGAIQIQIGEGSYKPHYLRSKGDSSDCPYVRPNTSKVANLEKVRQLLIDSQNTDITPQMQMVMEKMSANPQITDTELQEMLQIKRTRFYTLISQMVDLGIISITGRGKNKRYVVT